MADRAVADIEPGEPRELGRLVADDAVDRRERDLLERDDVCVEVLDDLRDPPEPLRINVEPPRIRERPGTDPGADVIGRDAQLAPRLAYPSFYFTDRYFTEPARSPCTK